MNYRSPLLTLSLLALALSCGKQGEGERCNHQNGNEDCDSNLACVTANINSCTASPSDPKCNPDLCCPPAPQRSRVEMCNEYQFGVTNPIGTGGATSISSETGGSAAGGDTGVAETGGSAAGGDTASAETGGSAAGGDTGVAETGGSTS